MRIDAVHVVVFSDIVARVHADCAVPDRVRNEVVLDERIVPFVVRTLFVRGLVQWS